MGSLRTLKRRRQRHARRAYREKLAAGLITPARLAEVNAVVARIFQPAVVDQIHQSPSLYEKLRRRS